MAWINGQWVDDETVYDKGPGLTPRLDPYGPLFGGRIYPDYPGGYEPGVNPGYNPTLDASRINESNTQSMLSSAPQARFAAGYTGDTSLDHIGTNLGPPPGRGGGVGGWSDVPTPPPPPTPPTWTQGPPFMPGPQQPPIYDRGPQMQPPFGGGLGDITQWNPAQPGIATQYQPPQVRPPMPPPPPTIGDVWPQPDPPQVRPPFPPITGWEPGGDVVPPPIPTLPPGPKTDHEFNVMQRERTKLRLAQDRAKTKKHYAKLRAKGASPQTIAKAKAKSKARGAKIKAQHPTRKTIRIDN